MKTGSKTGFVIFAHGSTIESANDAVRGVAEEMARAGGYPLVETAFLGGGTPDLAGGVSNLVAAGAERVVVIPYFLTLGLHLQRDLPELVAEVRQRFPELSSLEVTEPLDGHPALATILMDRAAKAL